jgi:N-methylhydantoinase A/oxoprolinase/acetone carboxylase beta subunit
VYERSALPIGHVVEGPAIVQQTDSTTWLPSYATAEAHESGNLVVTIAEQER